MKDLFLFLIAFQLKHFICDFPLQNKYMLGKFAKGRDWILPLSAHAAVHAFVTLILSVVALWNVAGPISLFTPIGLALADFCIHFFVDRLKASPDLGGRWKPDNKFFWWALGADQMAHHLTHYGIVYLLFIIRG